MQTTPTYTKPRNPKTEAAHKREVLWQISVPFVLAALVIIAIAVFAMLTTADQISIRADAALIWLLLPAIALTFLFLVINAGIVYALIRLIGALPGFMYQVQIFFDKVAFYTRKFSDTAASPFIKVKGFSALVHRLLQGPSR